MCMSVWMCVIECAYGHGCVCSVMCVCVLGVVLRSSPGWIQGFPQDDGVGD